MKWIRLWTDEVLKGTTFTELNLSERGLWWSLLLLAGDSMNPGIVELRKGVKYPHETLAIMVNCDRKTLRNGIKKLILVGKISLKNDGRIEIVNWKKYQTRYEKYYKNDKKGDNQENNNSAENNGIDMHDREEREVEEEVDKDKEIYKESGAFFDRFYFKYPKKIARNKCYKKWLGLFKGKAYSKVVMLNHEIITGLDRHIQYWINNNTEKEFIPHPLTWLNQARWKDEILGTNMRVKDRGYIAKAQEPDLQAQQERDDIDKQFTPEQLRANKERLGDIAKGVRRKG